MTAVSPRRSMAASAAAEAGRSAGSLAIARSHASAKAGDTPGTLPTGFGFERRCATAVAMGVSAANGRSPASISYSITPSEYTSEAGVAAWPAMRSGAM